VLDKAEKIMLENYTGLFGAVCFNAAGFDGQNACASFLNKPDVLALKNAH
jgi:hypothetical protein